VSRGPREREILDAASSAFYQRDFSGTSVAEVATSAGLSKGTIYNYVSSKKSLLAEIIRVVDEDVKMLERVARTEPDGCEAELRKYIELRITYAISHRPAVAVYSREYKRLGELERAMTVQARQEQLDYVAHLLAELHHDGLPGSSLSHDRAALMAHCVIGNTFAILGAPGARKEGARDRLISAHLSHTLHACGIDD
jgi:AcrR family transcriptional regulator